MRVAITGATGTVGRQLVAALLERGDQVTALTRDVPSARRTLGEAIEAHAWDPARGPAPAQALIGRDAVVNLAGESLAQRWSDQAKLRMRSSRIDGTRNLVQALMDLPPERRPTVLVSGSAVGYYGDHRHPAAEDAPRGEGFLSALAADWEAEAVRARELGLRVALVRTGDVLSATGGVLEVLTRITKFGAAGPLGKGDQPFPWIHVEDEVGIILLALDDARVDGPINAVAPGIVSQKQFAKALGRVLRRPAIAPAPAFAVRLLAGEMAGLVLEGACAKPVLATELGYRFAFPGLTSALDDLR